MIKCVLVDDEKIILDELCTLIKQTKVSIAGAYQDPYKALESITETKPDVTFLDIEMPGLNGIELAKKVTKVSPETQIVFVTAYEQYALNAFEACAVHYLLKPITQKKINEALSRVQRVKMMSAELGDVNEPSFVESKAGMVDRISVKDRDNIIVIKIQDIVYLRSESGKTVIVTVNGSFKARTGIQFWENKLKNLSFIRCHRSYIVNTDYITKMIHVLGEYKELALDYCNVNIPISRQKVGVLKQWLGIN